jgi:hypothetical protein
MNLRMLAPCFSLAVLARAQSNPVGTEPSRLEAFADRPGVHATWSSEIATLTSGPNQAIITAVVLEDGANRMRGVKIDLTNSVAHEIICLDEEAAGRTRDALVEIADAISRDHRVAGHVARSCMGAREFWPLYDWPWNKYHELNAEVCANAGNSALVLSGRGRSQSYEFANETAEAAASIFTAAIQQFVNQ